MSGWEGIFLAPVTLGSVCAAYWAGQRSIIIRFRDHQERRRRWREWEDFDE